MAITISGSGHKSTITLYGIHQGNGSFRKDTSTTHSQVRLMQEALTTLGYDTQGADGKFDNNTLAAVKEFQSANDLTADGYFGRNSLIALEAAMGGVHLGGTECTTDSSGTTPGGSGHDTFKDDSTKTYKQSEKHSLSE